MQDHDEDSGYLNGTESSSSSSSDPDTVDSTLLDAIVEQDKALDTDRPQETTIDDRPSKETLNASQPLLVEVIDPILPVLAYRPL